ncbi:MAG TPA: divalent metal cation transporter [Steroidobacteraceae bacterium]|nr:divalent metal cation transporter [Steroidobacteraceae bacterium]
MREEAGIAAGSPRARRGALRFWKALGPGLITGAADDDPSGIATYSQAGARFGVELAWTLLLTYPLMVAIQAICARIGRATGHGISGNLRAHYPGWLVQSLVLLVFAANTLNIGADLGAMAESARLLLPRMPGWICVVVFAIVCTASQAFLQHARYVAVLKWLTLSLLAYFGTLGVVHVRWGELARDLLWPQVSGTDEFWLTVVAIFGTTISPYLFFWQASQEVEDTRAKPTRSPLRAAPRQAPAALARIRLDTTVGMALSNLVALAILVTSAMTLHVAGVHEISTAAQAAQALRPLAGSLASGLFALGIVGTGLLSIPVLAGSAAYALGEARGWEVGLSRKPRQAKAFYGAIVLATVLGAAANVAALSPVKALVWVAVINGLVAVPVMVLIMLLGTRRAVMGQFPVSGVEAAGGWLATLVMTVAAGGLIVSWGHAGP